MGNRNRNLGVGNVRLQGNFQDLQSIPATWNTKRTLTGNCASSVDVRDGAVGELTGATARGIWVPNPGYVKRHKLDIVLNEDDQREGMFPAALATICCLAFMLYGLAALGGALYSVAHAKPGLAAYTAVAGQ